MAKNDANKEGGFKDISRGTLKYTGAIPDYGTVDNTNRPVSSNRTRIGSPYQVEGYDERPRGKVRHVVSR